MSDHNILATPLTEAQTTALLEQIAELNADPAETGCEQLALVISLVQHAPRPLLPSLLERAARLVEGFQYNDWRAAAYAELANLAEAGSQQQRDLCDEAWRTLFDLPPEEAINPIRHLIVGSVFPEPVRAYAEQKVRFFIDRIADPAMRAQALEPFLLREQRQIATLPPGSRVIALLTLDAPLLPGISAAVAVIPDAQALAEAVDVGAEPAAVARAIRVLAQPDAPRRLIRDVALPVRWGAKTFQHPAITAELRAFLDGQGAAAGVLVTADDQIHPITEATAAAVAANPAAYALAWLRVLPPPISLTDVPPGVEVLVEDHDLGTASRLTIAALDIVLHDSRNPATEQYIREAASRYVETAIQLDSAVEHRMKRIADAALARYQEDHPGADAELQIFDMPVYGYVDGDEGYRSVANILAAGADAGAIWTEVARPEDYPTDAIWTGERAILVVPASGAPRLGVTDEILARFRASPESFVIVGFDYEPGDEDEEEEYETPPSMTAGDAEARLAEAALHVTDVLKHALSDVLDEHAEPLQGDLAELAWHLAERIPDDGEHVFMTAQVLQRSLLAPETRESRLAAVLASATACTGSQRRSAFRIIASLFLPEEAPALRATVAEIGDEDLIAMVEDELSQDTPF